MLLRFSRPLRGNIEAVPTPGVGREPKFSDEAGKPPLERQRGHSGHCQREPVDGREDKIEPLSGRYPSDTVTPGPGWGCRDRAGGELSSRR